MANNFKNIDAFNQSETLPRSSRQVLKVLWGKRHVCPAQVARCWASLTSLNTDDNEELEEIPMQCWTIYLVNKMKQVWCNATLSFVEK